ncbi:MAG: alpha/beta hydrolase [Deltaproteobacteria bacterium]|nr:alpha/beta hydrolase [Deltaproteobacteria bacterium]
MAVRIFLHGLESSNQGTKAVFFRERYPDMLTPNFSGPLDERLQGLERILAGRSGIRLVGSSFGGLMAAVYAMQHEPEVERLVLLAPAIHLLPSTPYPERKISVPVWIYHGRNDEVVPLGDVQAAAGRIFPRRTFHVVDDDHYLHNTFKTIDWDALLQ